MDIVFKCLHGSYLFGTQNESSDKDYKVIFCHDLDSLITNPWESDRTKNVDANEETEYFSVRKFASMLSQQQTVALELLFSPPSNWVEFHSEWEILRNNSEKLVSKNVAPFVGYAKEQARVYSIKGTTFNVINELVKDVAEYIYLLPINTESKVAAENYTNSIVFKKLMFRYPELISQGTKYIGQKKVPYTMILDKQYENHISIGEWMKRLESLLESFGERAKKASQEGMDRKAMSHAVRIVSEAIELVTTGKLIFPRPEVDLLREIRYNESFTYDKTAEIINNLHDKLLLEILPTSKLQDEPDYKYITDWYLTTQKRSILNDYQ